MLNDKFFLDVASRLADESHCMTLHVGAVIVKDKRIISMGYNGTLTGAPNCNELYESGKFSYISKFHTVIFYKPMIYITIRFY